MATKTKQRNNEEMRKTFNDKFPSCSSNNLKKAENNQLQCQTNLRINYSINVLLLIWVLNMFNVKHVKSVV